jgi:hypothetical protein
MMLDSAILLLLRDEFNVLLDNESFSKERGYLILLLGLEDVR